MGHDKQFGFYSEFDNQSFYFYLHDRMIFQGISDVFLEASTDYNIESSL